MFAIAENLKYKQNISNHSFYFILPDDIDEGSATESDLILVRMKEALDIDVNTDYYPNGITIAGEKNIYNSKGEPVSREVIGKIIYESVSGTNIIKTPDGNKIRHSFTSDAGYVEYEFLPAAQLNGKFTLKYIFSVSKQIKIAVNSCGDVFFNSFEEAEKFTKYLTFYGGEINASDLMVVVNEKCVHYNHYDIFFNNEIQNIDHARLFEYLCTASKNIDPRPSYLKSFPLRPEWFEVIPVSEDYFS